jgi:hypothetical protein
MLVWAAAVNAANNNAAIRITIGLTSAHCYLPSFQPVAKRLSGLSFVPHTHHQAGKIRACWR